MKTNLIIAAAFLMLISSTAIASSPKRVLKLNDAFGRILTMPLPEEQELEEALPFDLGVVFHKARKEAVSVNIDISEMVKPEAEVNDLPELVKGKGF